MLFFNRYLIRIFIPLLLELIPSQTIGFADAVVVAGTEESIK